jgi:copper chaperone CopZ
LDRFGHVRACTDPLPPPLHEAETTPRRTRSILAERAVDESRGSPYFAKMTKHVVIEVGGMTCNGCVSSVRNVLARQPGVTASKVEIGKIELDLDDAFGSLANVRAAVENAGFTVSSTT